MTSKGSRLRRGFRKEDRVEMARRFASRTSGSQPIFPCCPMRIHWYSGPLGNFAIIRCLDGCCCEQQQQPGLRHHRPKRSTWLFHSSCLSFSLSKKRFSFLSYFYFSGWLHLFRGRSLLRVFFLPPFYSRSDCGLLEYWFYIFYSVICGTLLYSIVSFILFYFILFYFILFFSFVLQLAWFPGNASSADLTLSHRRTYVHALLIFNICLTLIPVWITLIFSFSIRYLFNFNVCSNIQQILLLLYCDFEKKFKFMIVRFLKNLSILRRTRCRSIFPVAWSWKWIFKVFNPSENVRTFSVSNTRVTAQSYKNYYQNCPIIIT